MSIAGSATKACGRGSRSSIASRVRPQLWRPTRSVLCTAVTAWSSRISGRRSRVRGRAFRSAPGKCSCAAPCIVGDPEQYYRAVTAHGSVRLCLPHAVRDGLRLRGLRGFARAADARNAAGMGRILAGDRGAPIAIATVAAGDATCSTRSIRRYRAARSITSAF